MGQFEQVDNNAERILVSVGWGRENVFTTEFETGTRARQADQLARLGGR